MFVETSEVAAYWQVPDSAAIRPHIDAAEALIAAALGAETLEAHEVTQTHVCPVRKQLVEFDDGPVSALVSLTVDGTEIDLTDEDEVIEVKPWFVRRNAGFSKSSKVVLIYTAGYEPGDSASDSNLPAQLRDAIIIAAGERYTQPDARKTSERIGDYAYTLQADPGQAQELSPTVLALIRKYRRP